jgi:hypothetical protein
MVMPSVLVACSVARIKDYSLKRYLDAYRAFDYEGRTSLFMVDNTPDGGEYQALLRELGLTVDHVEPDIDLARTLGMGFQRILTRARDYDYLFYLDSDIIVRPDALKKMVGMALLADAALVRHAYPGHNHSHHVLALGCSLVDPRALPILSEDEPTYNEEARWVRDIAASGRVIVDFFNFIELKHLNDPDGPLYEQVRKVGGIASCEAL